MSGLRQKSLCGVGVVALLAAAWLSPRAIPYNMDEFVHYHALGCASAPGWRALPLIRDGCGYFDLRLPLTTTPLPLRAYYYIGSLPALPFYPFWALVRDPSAARLAGGCLLLLATLLALRLLRVRASSLILASLVFPVWAVTFVVDEGPVGLSALLLLAALLLARRALAAASPRTAAAWAGAAGMALFLGLWTKLVFAWWLPAFVVLVLEEARRRSVPLATTARQRLPALAAGAATLLVPTAILLGSFDRAGRPYAAALRHGGVSTEPADMEAVALRLSQYATDGSLAAPRNLLLPGSLLDGIPLAATACLLALGLWRRARRREIATWAMLAALTFAFVAASGHSRWPHHFAFPLLPLVLALALAADALPSRGRLAAAAVVAIFWGSLALRLPSAVPAAESSPDKDRLLAFVRERALDRATLQVHASWGTYYIAQLFGDPGRMVVYARRVMDDPARLWQMADLSRAAGRPVLLVSGRRWDRLHTEAVEHALGRPERTWQFGDWTLVEYHPPPVPR